MRQPEPLRRVVGVRGRVRVLGRDVFCNEAAEEGTQGRTDAHTGGM